MTIRIENEDPAGEDIVALLQHGEAYAAALYPAESNHFLSIESLRAPNVHFIVARDDKGEAVGTGAVAINDGWAEVKRMWVVPAARGKGLSKALLADLERRAKDGGAEWLRLETGVANHEALALYERSGFVRREPFADYLPDPLSVFMEKRLGGR
jgi:putative acetyltransferase